MATVEKFSISLDLELAQFAREQADQAGQSLSAYLAKCIESQRQQESLQRLLVDLGADDIPAEVQRALDAELDELLRGMVKSRTGRPA